MTATAETDAPASMLTLYRVAIRIRRDHPGFATEAFRWIGDDPDVLWFERGHGLTCLVNLTTATVQLPSDASVILSSAAVSDESVPVDAAVWYSTTGIRRAATLRDDQAFVQTTSTGSS